MVDRDMKEIKAIKAVFPNTSVLLCWFHVLQAVHRWLMRQEGGNLRDPSLRKTVIRGMVSLKQCNMVCLEKKILQRTKYKHVFFRIVWFYVSQVFCMTVKQDYKIDMITYKAYVTNGL
uniref:MULE transposase domain-containing protein n=1 Tax=Astyanax mexicanus TaxID=7994 RepID=A0A8B9GYU7_ASTMX